MATIEEKIIGNGFGDKFTDLNVEVAQSLLDMENSNPEIQYELRLLQIAKCRKIKTEKGDVIIVYVPQDQLVQFQKIHSRYPSDKEL